MNYQHPDKPTPHRLRRLADKVLSLFGIALVPAAKPVWLRSSAAREVPVGRFMVQMPAFNPLLQCYLDNPDYTGHLGRITSLLKKKYPDLAAIDVGANVGDTASIIKSEEDIPVLCIEGDDVSFDFLQRNLKQFQNVAAHKLFLCEKTKTIAAQFQNSGWNTTILPNQGQSAATNTLQMSSLDDFLSAQGREDNFKLLKIDTEGFDCPIIRGSLHLIERTHPVITFEYNRSNMNAIGEKGLDTLAMLAKRGYSQIFFHDCWGRFFCSGSMSDWKLIQDLHDYADGKQPFFFYFDMTLFHRDDEDLAEAFAKVERERRDA